MAELLVGWGEIDITPKGRVNLSGQYYRRISKGIHSRLSATALAVESREGELAVMVSLDVVGISPDFQQELRDALRGSQPGLDADNVFLNAIHTHNAPGMNSIGSSMVWMTEPSGILPAREYRAFVLEKLTELVGKTWAARKPGGIANGLGYARVGHCRRATYFNDTAEMYGRTDREDFAGLEGGEDSGVDLLFTFDRKGRPTGVVLNLACPSQVMEATYKISADFMGETRRRLKEKFGARFNVLGQISAAGCQSPRDLTRNGKGEPDFWREEGVEEIGRRLSGTVETVLPEARSRIDFSPEVRCLTKKLSLPLRRASKGEAAVAEKQLRELVAVMPEKEAYQDFCREVIRNEKIPGRPGPYDSKLHHFVLIQNAKAVIARFELQKKVAVFDMELAVIRIGQTVFVSNPFELYLDYGHRIKARSSAQQTFVVQLCGGYGGYLPSKRAEQLGGYGGLIINGKVGSDGGKILVDETVASIRDVMGAGGHVSM